jgi:hypothetical protein
LPERSKIVFGPNSLDDYGFSERGSDSDLLAVFLNNNRPAWKLFNTPNRFALHDPQTNQLGSRSSLWDIDNPEAASFWRR